MFLQIPLYALVALGFYSGARLAWREFTIGEACPAVGSVPACYVVFLGYLAMVLGLALANADGWGPRVFYVGVAIAGGLALAGSILELVHGNVCPRAGSVPMCYVSLGMSVLIGALFWSRGTST